MEKKFNVAEYYIFDENNKKVGKAKICGFVEVDGTMRAVVSYCDNNDVSRTEVRTMFDFKGRMAIFLLDAGFIYSDNPEQLKTTGITKMKKVSPEVKSAFLKKSYDAIEQCCSIVDQALADLVIKTFGTTDSKQIAIIKDYAKEHGKTMAIDVKNLLVGSEKIYDELPEDSLTFYE